MDMKVLASGSDFALVDVIGAACGRGALHEDTRHGPAALRQSRLLETLKARGVAARFVDTIAAEPASSGVDALTAIADLCRRIAVLIEELVTKDGKFGVIGGDHSCAIGTWSGAARALRRRGPLGLIWIDAHMDAHTFKTTPSNTIHGMPLAVLLGHGATALTDIAAGQPALLPEHVCLVGVRSFERGEAELMRRLGVRIIFADEIAHRGMGWAMGEALAVARRGTAGFGLTLDLDVFDPSEAPGVDTPEPGGLSAAEVKPALSRIAAERDYLGVEVVEFNPTLDRNGLTLHLAHDMLALTMPGRLRL